MSDLKKVVDLIVVEPPKSPGDLIPEMLNKVNFWQDNLKALQEQYFENDFEADAPDVLEAMAMRKFLTQFLRHRIEWIRDKVPDPQLQKKYLQFLPPFYQKGGVKLLLMHFFQVKESDDKKFLVFRGLNDQEKEIRILWDLYKLNKTIESIDVLYRSISKGEPFQSIFPHKKQNEILQNLKTVFRLMFQMCIQTKYQKELYRGITAQHISPEAILERKEQGISFIYPHVLSKFNYRNHFFFIYFYSGMKAKIADEIKTFHYNFLDFEILKQEFLIHWMKDKLANNPHKMEAYQRYSLQGQSVHDLVVANPDKEIEILQQLPINVFNDLTAEVNENVSDELKTTVEALSENFGGFSEFINRFEKATKAAKATITKLKEMIVADKKPESKVLTPLEEPDFGEGLPPDPEEVEEVLPPQYELIKIKKKEVDFPYLTKTLADFQKTMKLIRGKMGEETYKDFAKDVSKILGSISESSLIQRRTPKHEWILPYLIKETYQGKVTEHLCFVGAEVKARQMGMSYSANAMQSNYQFTPFFIYGNNDPEGDYGPSVEKRNIRGSILNEYSIQNENVLPQFQKFFAMIKEK